MEDISEDESILDLLNNIDDLKTLEPSKSDGNNNCVLDQYVVPDAENGSVAIQDLEDISDREFLCVNDDGPAVRDGNSSDGIRSCENDRHGDDSHGAADSGASDSETVIGDDSGMLSGIEAVNSDDGRVENNLRMSGEDSVMDTNDDMVDVGEGSVDNDDDSDKGDSDCDELDQVITPEIRGKIRRKNKTHAKAKKTGSSKLRSKFETLRREIKADVRKQHDLYVNNLVGDVKANPRDFYRYINSQKKDTGSG